MSSSKLNSCFGVGGSGLSFLGFGIGWYPSWNCSGSGNMMPSLTLFRGMVWVLRFPIFQFSVGDLASFVGSLTI